MLRSTDKWYGVTYREDKPLVVEAIARKTAEGQYPENLWAYLEPKTAKSTVRPERCSFILRCYDCFLIWRWGKRCRIIRKDPDGLVDVRAAGGIRGDLEGVGCTVCSGVVHLHDLAVSTLLRTSCNPARC